MKQISIRLNDEGEKLLSRIKTRMGLTKNTTALEHCLFVYELREKEIEELRKEVANLQMIVDDLSVQ